MKLLALTGGVGGAKLALGLSRVLASDEIMFMVNTGDDFEHLGLHISPDIDSLTYALAEQNNQELGWGRAGETWQFIDTLQSLGGETWFRLGDKDLALHVYRSQCLQQGLTLTETTQKIAQAMGIKHHIIPMSDQPVRTIVHSNAGALAFQHYFVREQCKPTVNSFEFAGIEEASLNPLISQWLEQCDGIVICPSNPYVSVDPLLKLPGFLEQAAHIPMVAISPIVGGIAIKGPAAKMMQELNVPASPGAVAAHYNGIIDGIILDKTDQEQLKQITIPAIAEQTIMVTLQDRVDLAHATIRFLEGFIK